MIKIIVDIWILMKSNKCLMNIFSMINNLEKLHYLMYLDFLVRWIKIEIILLKNGN
jgi:hypothetical protein